MGNTKTVQGIAVGTFLLMPLLMFLQATFYSITVPLLITGGLSMLCSVWLYAFASFGFRYIHEHAKPYLTCGSAELEKAGHLSTMALGTQTGGGIKVTVNLEDLPVSKHFLGRWTVYLSEKDKLELWRDHSLFGGHWYYIQY